MAKDLENTMLDNNIFILTDINQETTNDLIMRLTKWMNKLQPYNAVPDKIYTPYETIPDNIPVLNVYINSGGGKTFLMQSILNLFNLASARYGTIIRTYNIARACSSASLIAVSGTKGYRYMSENTFNAIHFGSLNSSVNHLDEIKLSQKYASNWCNQSMQIYLNNTKLSKPELTRYYKTEGLGTLYAPQCLEKGLCDWIITHDGRFVNNIADLKVNQK